jgi:4-hydroxy-3-methylbut-2-enyl diphosphate reductase
MRVGYEAAARADEAPAAAAHPDAGFDVLLAQPRGFCAGVERAIQIVERALERYGAPVYVFHEIVHNAHVVAALRARGARFVDTIADIPAGAVTVFSAHGVASRVAREAEARQLVVIDATCPLVTKVHLQARRYARFGFTIVMIGHRGHEEVEGTMGAIDAPMHLVSSVDDVARLPIPDGTWVAYVTQTTLSLDETRGIIETLKRRFPDIEGPDLADICYATQNRQNAVRSMAAEVDLVLIVGARNSSNSNRLREVALDQRTAAYLIEDATQIDAAWLRGAQRVGVSAGASTPEVLVQAVRERLGELGARRVRELPGVRETVSFRLPVVLLRQAA